MANSSSTPQDFYDIVKALEDENYNRATELTEKNIKKLVHSVDRRDGQYVEEHFQYKYRLFERKGLSLLHYAALYDQPKMVEILLQNKADPLKEEGGRAKNNPFHYACMFGGEDTIKAFLSSSQHKDLANQGNFFTWKPLFYISERDEPQLIKLLISKGADPNGVSETTSNSVLQFATKYSSPACVDELLNCGERIDVDYQNSETGQRALHMACEEDNLKIVELLLNKNADVDALDNERRTALQVAILKGAEKCADILVEKNKLHRKNGVKLLMEATDKPKIFLNILRKYIRKFGPCSINLKNEPQEQRDVAHKIVRSEAYSEEEFTEAVTKLGKNCIEDEDAEGRTPIMVAAMLNKHRRLAILLDVNTRILAECLYTPDKDYYSHLYKNLMAKYDKKGFASIHLAVMCEGPDVDFEDTLKQLNSLRYNEKVGDYKEINPLLLQVDGLNSTALIDQGKTAMHLAIEVGKPERVLMLLRETDGKGVEIKDMNSSNVIHCAIEHKIRPAVFKQLLHLSKNSISTLREALQDNRPDEGTALQMALTTHQSIHAEHLLDLNTLTSRRVQERQRSLSTNYTSDSCDEIDGDDQLVDTNVTDEEGKNALRIAIENGSPMDLIIRLLENGCNPIMWVGEEQRLSIHVDDTGLPKLKVLLDHDRVRGGGLKVESKPGTSLLKTAVDEKCAEVAKFLLAKGARIKFDSTILRDVIMKEDKEFAWILVRYTDDTKDLVAQLRGIAEMEKSESGKEGIKTVLYHELIKKMPDVAEEALYRSILIEDGVIDYRYTKSLLLNEWKDEADTNQ